MEPTLAGFLSFIRITMGITPTVLPDNSPSIATSFSIASEIVNTDIAIASATIYTLAVYNLAGSTLLRLAPDQDGAAKVPGSEPPQAFFAYTRKQFNINGFVSGVVQSTSDNGTGNSMVVQEAAKNFTLADIQNLKDPYGRQYLEYAQMAGSLWGLS